MKTDFLGRNNKNISIMKDRLLVSFSGGETSALMSHILKENLSDKYEMIFVFANTGQENEETLEFADMCDKHFGLDLVWVEAVVHKGRKGVTHKVVGFDSASRLGEPFEDVIAKYMIPNTGSPHCTRELKERPIRHYAKSIGWGRDYYTAIGIRADEIDRISPQRKKNKLVYPLIEMFPMTKPQVNSFWDSMPFRLQLKGYEGNCKTCWKKSFRKLATIALEHPERFGFFRDMEIKYGHYIKPEKAHNEKLVPPFRFFRQNKSVDDIFEIAHKDGFEKATDDSVVYETFELDGLELDVSNGCIESCEVFS